MCCFVFDLFATDAAPAFLTQRAKIGKNSEGKSGNATSRFDSNGNQDRMKLADFNFLMVLGKGSFGKVSANTAIIRANARFPQARRS